jgi:hypothetical protein
MQARKWVELNREHLLDFSSIDEDNDDLSDLLSALFE